jgi:hypothetical protein
MVSPVRDGSGFNAAVAALKQRELQPTKTTVATVGRTAVVTATVTAIAKTGGGAIETAVIAAVAGTMIATGRALNSSIAKPQEQGY